MATTYLYIVRHGKTMFNSLGRAQGWCDSPLTAQGRAGIRALGRGLKEEGVTFGSAYTSDSGRTIETLRVLLAEQGQTALPHVADARLREWCFGSMEGLYDEELFHGVLPRTSMATQGKTLAELTYPEIAAGLCEADTAGWAEPWEVLRGRILEGFGEIAEQTSQSGGGRVLVICHGMTIATLLWLIDPNQGKTMIDNGSVTVLAYEDGQFRIEAVADLAYRQLGEEVLKDGK